MEMDDGDKHFKVRPLIEQIRQNCLKQHKKETKFSIDEMMIAYKWTKAGKRKQYMKDKPNKWGFKNVTAGASGIIYILCCMKVTIPFATISSVKKISL